MLLEYATRDNRLVVVTRSHAGVAELADAMDSKSIVLTDVPVQVGPPVLRQLTMITTHV